MIIAYRTLTLRKVCEDPAAATRSYGVEIATRLRARLADIDAADSIDDLLVGNPTIEGRQLDRLVVALTPTTRTVWKHNYPPNQVPLNDDGRIDWLRVNRVMIISIERDLAWTPTSRHVGRQRLGKPSLPCSQNAV